MSNSKHPFTIAVWGLGHVGQITAAYLSRIGYRVYGIDLRTDRVAAIKDGDVPSSNAELRTALSEAIASRQLECIDRSGFHVLPHIVAHFLCVDTPTSENGEQSLQSIKAACCDICSLSQLDKETLIVVRSTVLPGTTDHVIVPYLESLSRKREGLDFFVLVNPCFVRDVDYLEDLQIAERVVIGAPHLLDTARLANLYGRSPGKLFQTSCVEAELVKYVDNAFHALKVVFANEVGDLAQQLQVSMDIPLKILSADHRLNISAAYLEPGEPYGGRCLPKDLSALDKFVQSLPMDIPLLRAISLSNVLRTAARRGKDQIAPNSALQRPGRKPAGR